MELLVLVIGLVVVDLLAIRFGFDSRDAVRIAGRAEDTRGVPQPNFADDNELARQTREARYRRLIHNRTADPLVSREDSDLARAA